MIIGIDASNLRGGGGVTHLIELLRSADPFSHGFSKIIVWGGTETLNHIENRPWLVKSHQPCLDKNLIYRISWQQYVLSRKAREFGCDVLFVPGGLHIGNFHPAVTMCRNMLPFERLEFMRFGSSLTTTKMMVLRRTQSNSFKNADGLIFLTRYAKEAVLKIIKSTAAKTTIIPHGVDERFRQPHRKQKPFDYYSQNNPFRVLYVSIVTVYKHQWHVAEAVASLRNFGLPVVLDLIGPAYPPALKRLQKAIRRIDQNGQFVRYVGPMPYNELHKAYAQGDMVLFASSCENMPNILLEGMASGLPVACSNRGPMPEILQDGGVYFDPENPGEIANAIQKLMESKELRNRMAKQSAELSQAFSWKRCAAETFAFLAEVALNRRG